MKKINFALLSFVLATSAMAKDDNAGLDTVDANPISLRLQNVFKGADRALTIQNDQLIWNDQLKLGQQFECSTYALFQNHGRMIPTESQYFFQKYGTRLMENKAGIANQFPIRFFTADVISQNDMIGMYEKGKAFEVIRMDYDGSLLIETQILKSDYPDYFKQMTGTTGEWTYEQLAEKGFAVPGIIPSSKHTLVSYSYCGLKGDE